LYTSEKHDKVAHQIHTPLYRAFVVFSI